MIDLGQLPGELSSRMNTVLHEEDPLLGDFPVPEPGPDVVAVLPAASARAVAVARVRHTALDSPLSLWQASTHEYIQLRLSPEATSPDVAEILDAWLAHPEPEIAEEGGDRARSVRLPVTAHQAVLPLVERGFAPSTVTLARRVRSDADQAGVPAGAIRVRPATAGDRARMQELMRELIRTEAPFGAVRQRSPELSGSYADEALGFDPGWTVVAEIEGEVVGWASISPPEHSQWAAPSVSTTPAAYLGVAIVTGAARSGGVGRAMVADLHRQAAAAGVDTVLLDASVLNPWSVPFWHRQAYRPLWTTWQRRLPTAA